MNKQTPLLIVGVLLILAAAVMKFAISPRWEARFSPDWAWETTLASTSLYADQTTGQFPDLQFPDEDNFSIANQSFQVLPESIQGNTLTIRESYVVRDVNTNVIAWEFSSESMVDARTGQYVNPEYATDYILFPRNVEKTTYHIRSTSYQGIPLEFDGEEVIGGVTFYKFSYPDDSLDTTVSAGPSEEGQMIICYGFETSYWVEPLTGEVLKNVYACPGDAVIDIASGETLYYISRWSGETTTENQLERLSQIKQLRSSYLMNTRYIPLGLLVVGLILAGIAGLPLLKRSA